MISSKPLSFFVALLICGALPAASPVFTTTELEEAAATWLIENTSWIPCDENHFVYGVGYLDGSYIERIFFAEGIKPELNVRFREDALVEPEPGADIDAVPFVLEIKVPRVLHAVPSGQSWRLGEEGWESSLRFKYTSWFGEIGREDGKWQVRWQGYRRPILPESVTEHAEETCALFAVE